MIVFLFGEKSVFYLMREMLECPAVLVTMLMSVRGLGSVERNSNPNC